MKTDLIDITPATDNATTIAEHLAFDPLAEAEKITGNSYKDDDATGWLGMALAMGANEKKRQALQQAKDTHFGMSLQDLIEIARSEGFAEVYREAFTGSDGQPETFILMWSAAEGLLLRAESYSAWNSVNSVDVYYNLRTDKFPSRSSGGFANGAFVGHCDGREGLRHHLAECRKIGAFLPQWVKRPFLWLLTYMDPEQDGYDYNAINERRISALPESVQQAIRGQTP